MSCIHNTVVMTEKAPDIVGFILKTYLAIQRSYNLLMVLYRLLYISYPLITRYCLFSFSQLGH